MTSSHPSGAAGTHSSKEFQALLDAAVDGIVIIDHQGRIESFNSAAERLFGFAAREVLGANVNMLMAEPDRSAHDGHLTRYIATHTPHILGRGREVKALRKDGSIFPVFLSVGAVQGAEPPRFVGFVQDVSFQRRAEADNHQLQERLTRVSRLATVGEMSAGIAHELNQPLAAVANYAQACDRLLALPDADIEEIRGALQQITAQAVRAGDIIRRLRALARCDAMRREPTDINSLLGELNELIQLDATAHDSQYTLETTPGLPQLDVDRAHIQQVVLNLVRNAFEALSEAAVGTRQVTVSTRLLAFGEVEIAVSDNGPGVAREIAPRLFEPFCTTKSHGTGLGLAISRTIIRSHQGSLDYSANTPRGARFSVRLPPAKED